MAVLGYYKVSPVNGGFSVSLKRSRVVVKVVDGGTVEYTRFLDERPVSRRLVSLRYERDSIAIHPTPSISTPRRLTSLILVKLSTPIILAPRASVEVTLSIPIDVAVYAYREEDERYRVVDVFNEEGKVKYTLYGRPSDGEICRFHVSTPTTGFRLQEASSGLTRASLPLRLVNHTGLWVEVTRALVDSASIDLYFNGDDQVFTQEVEMRVDSRRTATVSYGDRPPEGFEVGAFKAIRSWQPPVHTPLHRRTLMEWGI